MGWSNATRTRTTLVAAFAVALAVPATSSAYQPPEPTRVQEITVVNTAGVDNHLLARVKWAVQQQVDAARRSWGTPAVRFGPDGWKVAIVSRGVEKTCSNDAADGCHSTTNGVPWGIVGAHGSDPWSQELDHEILEMLADPQVDRLDVAGSLVEICDPIENWDYLSDGVWLSDYALPAAFAPAPHGRMDYLGLVTPDEITQYFAFENG